MEAAAVNTATAPPQSPSPQRTQPPPQLPSQQRMPQLSTSPQRTQPSRPMPGTPTLRPPAPRAPAPPATSGIPAAGRPPVPPRVTVHLAPYNGLSSVVQWWLNFLSYVQLYQLADDQAINILPFYFTEPLVGFTNLKPTLGAPYPNLNWPSSPDSGRMTRTWIWMTSNKVRKRILIPFSSGYNRQLLTSTSLKLN